MDAFDEFRQDIIYYDFNNYKSYYQDALQQNIQQSLGSTQNLNQYIPIYGPGSGGGNSLYAPRDRESSVSFMDKRLFT
jgi:hypothetical protein